MGSVIAFPGLSVTATGVPGVSGVAVLMLRSRKLYTPVVAPPPPVAAPAVAAPSGVDPLRAALAAFRAQGDDASLDALREQLFRRAGAAPGATFADAVQALGGRQPELARVIAIAERARFGPVDERAVATRNLLTSMDALLDAQAVHR